MATAEHRTITIEGYAKEIADLDPKAALEMILEHTRAKTAVVEREKADVQLMAQVKIGPGGLECDNLASLWRLARMYASSDMVPTHYQGKPENCMIALQMAQRCKVDPFMMMQNSFIVQGRPGIEAKLAIAMLNASGKIAGRVRYRFTGEGQKRACTAVVTDKESGETIEMGLDWSVVKGEKWDSKGGSKWNTMPDQMFRYRSAVFLIRAHYPEVLMGMITDDEAEDIDDLPPEPLTGNGHDTRSPSDQIADLLDRKPDRDLPDDRRRFTRPPKNEAEVEPAGEEPPADESDEPNPERPEDGNPFATKADALAYGIEGIGTADDAVHMLAQVDQAFADEQISEAEWSTLTARIKKR